MPRNSRWKNIQISWNSQSNSKETMARWFVCLAISLYIRSILLNKGAKHTGKTSNRKLLDDRNVCCYQIVTKNNPNISHFSLYQLPDDRLSRLLETQIEALKQRKITFLGCNILHSELRKTLIQQRISLTSSLPTIVKKPTYLVQEAPTS